jgi:ParB family chromosome partitioning protein
MSEQFAMIPINLLEYSGRNPRQEMRNLEEFAENIKEYGILEPIIVRPKGEKFEVVVGERRVRAAMIAGLKKVPTIVRTITDRQADELRLIENIHREDLTNAEKGDAILALLENYPDKYPTMISIAKKLSISWDSVRHWVMTTRKASEFVKQCVFEHTLGEDQARRLLKYESPTQEKLAKVIMRYALTERETIAFLKRYDENPRRNLDEIAQEVKGYKVITIPVEKLPKKTLEDIKRVLTKKEPRTRPKELIRKTAETLKETYRLKEKARKRLEEKRKKETPLKTFPADLKPKQLIYTTEGEPATLKPVGVPKEVIRQKAEALIEKLNEIEHPLQRERMAKVIPKELDGLVKRLEKAPEKRELVETKLDRLRELEKEGVFLSTLWDIGERAEYAGTREFHGNCPPQVIEQCVIRLTRKGDLVVDPMAGSGTAIDVCNVLDRKCIAYDIKPPKWRKDIIPNDSRKIPLSSDNVDMVFLHPPYWDMVYYTKAEEKLPDLSRAKTLEEYLDMLKQVLRECYRILKKGKYLCILLGDRIKEGRFIPLCRKAANLAEEVGFTDCGYAIKFTKGATSLMVKGKMIYAELAYTENLKIEHDLVMFFRKGERENVQ